MSIEDSIDHGIQLSEIGIPKEVMKDIEDSRALLRELISNAGAEEVDASSIKVSKFTHREYGLSFEVEDNGCGMSYTGDEDDQGRLDRFLNLGYSEVAGLDSDEFSHKGLGSALMYNSKRVEIETYDGETLYDVVIDDPRGHFWKENPEPPEPRITRHNGIEREEAGTKVTIYGFGGGDNAHYKKYSFGRIKEYLKWRTLVGCTKDDRVEDLPTFILNVDGDSEEVKPGYPWILDDGSNDTLVFDPVTVTKEEGSTEVSVTVKGGMTMNTSDHELRRRYAGLTVAVNGIPYFRDRGFLEGRFSDIGWQFTNLVVECDDLNLNISRNNYHSDDLTGQLFNKAVKEAVRSLENSEEYQDFAAYIREKKRRKKAGNLEERKSKIQNESQKYVTVDDDVIHSAPRSENDTLAVLWKLEAQNLLPFHEFTTLEHTGWEGIDLLVDFQEKAGSEQKRCVSVEIERDFSNFESHGHPPTQTDYVICWNMNSESVSGHVEELNQYKYSYKTDDQVIEVFALNEMTNIEIRQRGEIDYLF